MAKRSFESFEHFFDRCNRCGFQHRSAVLDRDLDVVVALGDIMVPAPEVAGEIGRHGGSG